MKELIKNKWAWAVLILVILNIATIGAIWASLCGRGCHRAHRRGEHPMGMHHKGEHSHHGAGRGDYFAEALNLTPEQQVAFDSLRKEHFKTMKSSMELMAALKKEVIQNLGKPESELETIFQKISALELKNQKDLYNHFNNLYSICTDSQKVLLKEKLSNVMHHPRTGFREGGPNMDRKQRMHCEPGNSSKGKRRVEQDTLEAEMP